MTPTKAGHLTKHGKRKICLDILGEDGLNPQEEREADAFSRDVLIPPSEFKTLLAQAVISERMIRDFADRIGIALGIVLGRLQFERRIGWQQFNHLKVSYRWNHET